MLCEARGTAAGEGAHGVDTDELAVVLPGGALIQVCGTGGSRGQGSGLKGGAQPEDQPRGRSSEELGDGAEQTGSRVCGCGVVLEGGLRGSFRGWA